MQKTYVIEGMTCKGCVNSVKQGLESLSAVRSAEVQLSPPRASLQMQKELPLAQLQEAIGKYRISEIPPVPPAPSSFEAVPEASMTTYRPLLMIIAFLVGVTILTQYPFDDFNFSLWMRHFMAGFFLVFAFFKLLNLRGFADSYRMYDIVAARWYPWGLIYPFVELGLGIAYLINFAPVATNWTTVIVLGISSIGVIQSNLNKRKIKCACLGDVFNLPMSTVTIVEDLTMVAMAGWMLWG